MQAKARFVATALILIALIGTASAETYYADPVNGSMGNDGSYDNPWRTAEEVFAAGLIGTTVQPGDTLLLRDGYHGEINYSNAHNSDYITIAAQEGHTPKFMRFWLRDASKWVIKGLSISPEFAPGPYSPVGVSGIVRIVSNSHDIIIEDNNIFSVQDTSNWSCEKDVGEWDNLASYGIVISDYNHIIRNNTIKNVFHGIVGGGENSLIEYNELQNIAGDGVAGGANGITIQYNTFKNFYCGLTHKDGIQFHRGRDPSPFYDVTIRGNHIMWKEPNLDNPLLASPEGIVAFDYNCFNWLVENNVVLVSHHHGITIVHAINSTIVNNIAFDPTEQEMSAWITSGSKGQNTVVRNNMSRVPPGPNPDQNIVAENNIDIDDYGPDALFVDYKNYDVRHKPGSPAIDAGSSDLAPDKDILGVPRPQGAGYDIGAYEFVQLLSCTSDSDCDVLDSLPCLDYYCDTGGTNTCIQTNTDGTNCNDGDACTLNDACSNGTCIGTQKDCADNIECTDDVCIAGVCQNNPDNSFCGTSAVCATHYCDTILDCQVTYNMGADCDDGITCTEGDKCDATGNCQPGNPNDSKCLEGFPLCTNATCDPIQGCVDYQPVGCNIPSDLVLWMTFKEGSGSTAADSSENRNDGTLYNGPAWSTDCPEGSCILFDGKDDYIEVQDSDSLANNYSEMTWGWWAKPLSIYSETGIIKKYDSTNDQRAYYIKVYAGSKRNVRLLVSSDGTSSTLSYAQSGDSYIVLDEWHHYAITFNAGAVTFYRDGSQFSTGGSMTPTSMYNNTAPLLIGKHTYHWNGLLDEIKIYNRALSSEEILALYNETAPACVDIQALMNYIGQWKRGEITMLVLMQKIGKWKSGTGCS